MNTETITLEYEGEEFEYEIEKYLACEHCGTSQGLESETEPLICPECNQETEGNYRASYHFYIKMAWWFDSAEPSVTIHAEALRLAAQRLEALEANGWEMVESDGEHVYFEREWSDEGSGSEFKVSEPVE